MKLSTCVLVAAILSGGTAGVAHAQAPKTDRAPLPPDSLLIARKYTQWFLTSMSDSLYAHMDSGMKAASSVAQVQQQMDGFTARAGSETLRMEEKWILRRGRTQYWYQSTFSQAPEPVVLRWVLNAKGEASGMGLGLLSQSPAPDALPVTKDKP